MTVALIAKNPAEIKTTFAAVPSNLLLPNGDIVEGEQVGWSNADYALVAVIPFAVPAGMMTTGEPSYAFDAGGNVVETYATTAAPSPTYSFLQLMALFTSAEQAAIAASTDPQVKIFIMMATGSGGLQLNNPQVVAGVNYLVSVSLLTSARATAILAGQAPA